MSQWDWPLQSKSSLQTLTCCHRFVSYNLIWVINPALFQARPLVPTIPCVCVFINGGSHHGDLPEKGGGGPNRGTDALSLCINQHHKNPAGSRCRSSLEQCVWRAETALDVIHALGPSGYTSQMGLIAQRAPPPSGLLWPFKSILRSAGNSRPGGPMGATGRILAYWKTLYSNCKKRMWCFRRDVWQRQVWKLAFSEDSQWG